MNLPDALVNFSLEVQRRDPERQDYQNCRDRRPMYVNRPDRQGMNSSDLPVAPNPTRAGLAATEMLRHRSVCSSERFPHKEIHSPVHAQQQNERQPPQRDYGQQRGDNKDTHIRFITDSQCSELVFSIRELRVRQAASAATTAIPKGM
jgi:hypothetical protein